MIRRDHANLDVLRSTAVLLVLLAHLIMALGHLDDPLMKAWGLRQLAQLGVLIFFIHTSFVLMMSLERLENSGNIVGRFYIRRAFRIYPLAVLTVSAALLFRIPPHFEPRYIEPTAAVLWQNLFLIQNLFQSPDIVGPMWSLPLEVQMYLVLPLLYFAAKRILSYSGALTIMACGFVVWYVDSHAARLFGYRAPLNYAPWFFMGIAAYRLYRFVTPNWSPVLYGLSLLLLVTLTCLTQRLMGDDYRAGWVSWAIGIFFAFALPHFLEVRSQLMKRVSHAVATYSYGIYLSHVPIMWLTFHKLSSQSLALQILLFLALQATVPIALYHGLEKPMIELGRRLGDMLGGHQPNSEVLERLPAG